MPSRLRLALLAWIAACQVYLFSHSQEPLRLDIGDPWSDANVLCSIHYVKDYGFLETSFTDILDVGPLTDDSYRYTHYPPLAEITYGAIGKYLGVSSIGIYRLFALLFSAGAMALLFLYARRMYGETVALVATALWQGSLLWLLYADSIHQAPIFQLTTFLGLWGLERAIATKEKRFYVAAIGGAFGCFLTSYDGWLFFPAAVLFTVYAKAGNPFARGNRHFVVLCAAGCIAALAAKAAFVTGAIGWTEFLKDLHFQFLERTGSTFDRQFGSPFPTLSRRFTQVFTPMVWITVAYHGIRCIRAPSITFALRETAAWLLLCGVGFFYLFSELSTSQLLPAQVMLPFYAIGTGLIVERMLARTKWWRVAACVWLGAAALWGGFFMMRIPRAVMETDEVEKINDYLAKHDHNDFVLNNLMAAGEIQWTFDKHDMPIYSGGDVGPEAAYGAQLYMRDIFEQTNASSVSAVVFKEPGSRYLDKSLWGLAATQRLWSVTGSPYLWPAKAKRLISEYDHRVIVGLAAVDAVRVIEGRTMDVYRIDRAKVTARLEAAVPERAVIDIYGASSSLIRGLGWGGSVTGRATCKHVDGRQCKTVLTKTGLEIRETKYLHEAELLLRMPATCSVPLTIELRRAAPFGLTVNGQHQDVPFTRQVRLVVPVHAGVNWLAFSSDWGAFEHAMFGPGAQVGTISVGACTP